MTAPEEDEHEHAATTLIMHKQGRDHATRVDANPTVHHTL